MTDIVFVCMTCRKRIAKLEPDVDDMVYLNLEDGICEDYRYPCTKCSDYEPVVEHDNSKEKEND